MAKKYEDLTGQRFGKLIALEYLGYSKWLCKCDCGNYTKSTLTILKKGIKKSCGCLTREAHTTHGQRYTLLYKKWQNMKSRCLYSCVNGYNNYGGRGIKVCNEWLHSFENFYNWSINNGYKEGLSINRIDVNGDYEPINCRWINNKIQARNTRRNHFLTYNGETHCLKEWSDIVGIDYGTLKNRVKGKWKTERALTEKVNLNYKRY